MSSNEVLISDGPGKADLTRAVLEENRGVSFSTDEGVLEAQLKAVQDLGDHATFIVRGVITSGRCKGQGFVGTYDSESHWGNLKLESGA